MLTFVLPLLFTIPIWAAGRAISGCARDRQMPEGTSLLVGFGFVVLILSWMTFVAKVGTLTALFDVVPPLAFVIALGWRHVAAVRWRDIALPACVLVITYVHYLWPVLVTGTQIPLYSATDFTHYVAVAAWLQDHSILDALASGTQYNTLMADVSDHQGSRLRIGALLLMSLFGSAAGSDMPHAYAGYCALVLGLESVAVAVIARRLAPTLPAWVAGLAGVLFGISPTATWAVYASFVPQTLGLAFAVVGVAAFVDLLDFYATRQLRWREALLHALPVGLLFFAAWSAYPEAVPLAAFIILCYGAIAYGRRLRERAVRMGLLQAGILVGALAILLSPLNFQWGVRGMQLQVQALGHGMDQHVNPWSLFGVAVGAMEQPMFESAGTLHGRLAIISLLACLAALAGIVYMLAGRARALPVAIVVSGLVLVGYVMHRYSFARLGTLPDWQALYTWNQFKAAGYIAPFAVALSLVGVAGLAQRFGRTRGLRLATGGLAAALVTIAVAQDAWSARALTLVRIEPELGSMVATIPPGRLLVDVHNIASEGDFYHRYAIYPLLRGRAFVSTRDWLPHEMHTPDHPARADFLKEPFSYVLTDRPGAYPRATQVAAAGRYRVLDVRKLDFAVDLNEFGRPHQTLVNLAASESGRNVSVTVAEPGPGKVLYDAGDGSGLVPVAERAGATPVRWQLAASENGGLRHILLEPAPEAPLDIALRNDGRPPARAPATAPAAVAVPASAAIQVAATAATPAPAAAPTATPAAPPAAVAVPARIDLKPQLVETSISTDPNGAKMTVERTRDSVRLTMPRAGTSRVQLWARLVPGEYQMHLELGQVSVEDKDPGGFGAFLGLENNRAGSMEIQPRPNSHQYLRVTVTRRGMIFFALGYGGWGRARGSMEIKTLELVSLPAKP